MQTVRSLALLTLLLLGSPAFNTSHIIPAPLNRPTAPAARTVTQEDDRATITLRVRDRLLIKLGSEWDWTLDPLDATILENVTGEQQLPPGAQALLETRKKGKTPLSATGDPPCAKSRPPCNLQSRQFRVTIVVE